MLLILVKFKKIQLVLNQEIDAVVGLRPLRYSCREQKINHMKINHYNARKLMTKLLLNGVVFSDNEAHYKVHLPRVVYNLHYNPKKVYELNKIKTHGSMFTAAIRYHNHTHTTVSLA